MVQVGEQLLRSGTDLRNERVCQAEIPGLFVPRGIFVVSVELGPVIHAAQGVQVLFPGGLRLGDVHQHGVVADRVCIGQVTIKPGGRLPQDGRIFRLVEHVQRPDDILFGRYVVVLGHVQAHQIAVSHPDAVILPVIPGYLLHFLHQLHHFQELAVVVVEILQQFVAVIEILRVAVFAGCGLHIFHGLDRGTLLFLGEFLVAGVVLAPGNGP